MQTVLEKTPLVQGWRGPPLEKGLVLIDDDQDFCEIMKSYAAAMNVHLKTYASFLEIQPFASLKNFDLALVDYHLHNRSGLEIAEYIDVFFRGLPVIIISADEILEAEIKDKWPLCIRKCMQKKYGPQAILRRSLSLLIDILFYKKAATRLPPY